MRGQKSGKRPTQRSIADEVGISVAAVSRALSNDPMISAETRRLVRQKAEEMAYVPDRAAQRLRTGRTNVISLILPPHDEILGFGTSMLRGITTGIANTSYHLLVTPDFGTEGPANVIRRIVENGHADGVILSRTEPNDFRIRFLMENDFPFVSHGRTELATPHAFVDYDNHAFAHRSVLALKARGATRIMIFLPPERLTFHHHLRRGFLSAIHETGVCGIIEDTATLDSKPEEIASAIRMRFTSPEPPNGLILAGDASTLAAMAALDDIGSRPGRDVHLMVKQTSGVFDHMRPRVTSMFEDITSAGELMARFLIRRIEGVDATQLQHVQECKEITAHE